MPDLTLVLVPLLVLPIVLLFRFIGCAKIAGLGEGREPFSTAPPNYRAYIMSDPNATAPGLVTAHPEVRPNVNDVVAYWRLVDPEKTSNPNGSPDVLIDAPAIDEKGFQNGFYAKATCAREDPSPTQPGAEESALSWVDDFSFGHPSLIVSDPLQSCRGFDGGYVVIPSTNGLYPQEFTIEAWVWPKWGENRDTGWEHTLFFGQFAPSDPGAMPFNGFAVVADKTGHWQVRLNAVGDLFKSPPVAWTLTNGEKTHVKTHLAVTFAAESGRTRVRLFVYGTEVHPASDLVDYSAPKSGALVIGVAIKASPTLPIVLHRPLIGLIQEVVLHRKALSAEEIANHVDINRLD